MNVLRRLLRFAAPYWRRYLLSFCLVFGISALNLLQPMVIRWVIDGILELSLIHIYTSRQQEAGMPGIFPHLSLLLQADGLLWPENPKPEVPFSAAVAFLQNRGSKTILSLGFERHLLETAWCLQTYA